MCNKLICPCRWIPTKVMDEFTGIFNVSYTTLEETYIDTEPDIAGPLRELDKRAAEERRRKRGM